MNIVHKAWLTVGTLDLLLTIGTYVLFEGTPFVYICIMPMILLLVIWIPLQRMINKINKKIKEQNGKCYNCNNIMDEDTATLEDNDHVYCHSCDRSLFPNKYYEKNGVWYRNEKYDGE